MQVTVLDTETTGVDPAESSVVEIAGVDLESGEWHQSLVSPDHPISFGAMATHLITEEMVADAPPLEQVMDASKFFTHASVYVAHNAEFDRSFLPAGYREDTDIQWICTYRCALHLMPDAESHRNLALCLEAGLDIMDSPSIEGDPGASMPHRALFDAWATRRLLDHLIDLAWDTILPDTEGRTPSREQCIERLIELTQTPVLLRKVRFGKHSGSEWSEVPVTYLHWVLGQDFDEDVRHTAQYWLKQRGRA